MSRNLYSKWLKIALEDDTKGLKLYFFCIWLTEAILSINIFSFHCWICVKSSLFIAIIGRCSAVFFCLILFLDGRASQTEFYQNSKNMPFDAYLPYHATFQHWTDTFHLHCKIFHCWHIKMIKVHIELPTFLTFNQ